MSICELIKLTLSGAIGAIVSAYIFGYLNWHRERRKRAIDLVEKFLTSENLLKARLTSQTYLVPGLDRDKYIRFHKKNFEEINELLERGTDQEKLDRVYIRALPSFFWLVDQAMQSGVIPKDAKYWSRFYSFYWVMVIEPRSRTLKTEDPLYQRFDWMLLQADIEARRKELNERLSDVAADSGIQKLSGGS